MANDKPVFLPDHQMMFKMWDPETNDRLATEIDVFNWHDETVYNWRCKDCSHRFSATLSERRSFYEDAKYYCPVCYPNEGPPENYEDSFEAQFPVEAALWNEYRIRYGAGAKAAKDIKPGNYIDKIGFQCPQPGHDSAVVSSIDFILGHVQSGRPCHRCRQNSKYDEVPPGEVFSTTVMHGSASENLLRAELEAYFHLAWPGVNALKFAGDFMGNEYGRPDILIPGLRVAIEFDGRRSGKRPTGHVTRDGKQQDILKDQRIREVGWEVVRVRTGRMGILGPFDVKVREKLGPADTPKIIWAVINASLELDTLIHNLAVLKQPAEDLIMGSGGEI